MVRRHKIRWNLDKSAAKWLGLIGAAISVLLGGYQVATLLAENRQREHKAVELMATAERQSEAGDYSQAWQSAGEAVQLVPSRLAEQATLGMKWLRNIRVSSQGPERSFTEIVDKILPILYQSIDTSKKADASTMLAHIGWANYLRFRDGNSSVRVDDVFMRALKLDSSNVYAHAMFGFWLMYPNHDGVSLEKARAEFDAALGTRLERSYVRFLQISACCNGYSIPYGVQLVLTLNSMRNLSDPIPALLRDRVLDKVYCDLDQEVLNGLNGQVSPADQFSTFLYVTRGVEKDTRPCLHKTAAILRANAGIRGS